MKQKNKAQAKAKGKGKGKKRKAKAKAKDKAFTPSDDEGSQISKKQRVKDDEAKSTLHHETGDDVADVQDDMMPPVPPPADPPPADPLPAEPALSHGSDSKPSSSSCRAPAAPRVNRTPEEIFRMMVPNRDFVIHLKYNDWRLESQCRLVLAPKESSVLYAPYSQKTFSRAFISIPWQDALTDVHYFTWRKWRLLKHLSPLGEGVSEQVPGQVPKACFDLLQPVIEKMDPPKYGGKLKT